MDKRDANERDIVSFWRHLGFLWVQMDRYAGFDGLLVTRSSVYIVEIKNPAVKWRLTENEKERKEQVEQLGQKYNVIQTLSDASKLVGVEWAS